MKFFERFGLVLFILIIMIFASHLFLLHSTGNVDRKYFTHGFTSHQREAYGNLSEKEISTRWEDAYNGGMEYKPFIGFIESDTKSTHVNVKNNERLTLITTSASVLNQVTEANGDEVWVFGGSTTYGYGLSDVETIPSRLQANTNLRVRNFGHGHYYSAQENLLLQENILRYTKPKIAIFIDGINERCDLQSFQTETAHAFSVISKGYYWDFLESLKPLRYVVGKFKGFLLKTLGVAKQPEALNSNNKVQCQFGDKKYSLGKIVSRNLEYRKLICKANGIKCITFLQPFAGMHGKHVDYEVFPEANRMELKKKYLEIKQPMINSGAIDISDSINAMGLQSYVDDVHYSPKAADLIAKRISRVINK